MPAGCELLSDVRAQETAGARDQNFQESVFSYMRYIL
jgi:hypothetical protein